MTRPHRWVAADVGSATCTRCDVRPWHREALTDCPVVTPSDACEALAWVLGQVWRAYAQTILGLPSASLDTQHWCLTVALLGPMAEVPGWHILHARRSPRGWRPEPVRGPYADFDDARAAALERIEELGDG